MDLFHPIDDAECIVRMSNGVFKQVKLYHRRKRVYAAVGGGFARIVCRLSDDEWGLSISAAKVVDMPLDHEQIDYGTTGRKEPLFKA